jgi:hypothetical protein
VRCLKYAYQILLCFNCNTLLKFFEMIKTFLSYFSREDMDVFLYVIKKVVYMMLSTKIF